jgi:hypothetical protein
VSKRADAPELTQDQLLELGKLMDQVLSHPTGYVNWNKDLLTLDLSVEGGQDLTWLDEFYATFWERWDKKDW